METPTPSRHRLDNEGYIAANAEEVRAGFEYDQDGKHWSVTSWSSGRRYDLHYRIIGTVLITSCSCPGAGHKTLCKHELALRDTVIIPRGAYITRHISAGNAVAIPAARGAGVMSLPVEAIAGKHLKNTGEPWASLEMNLRMGIGYVERYDLGRALLPLKMALAVATAQAETEQGEEQE